MAEKMKYRVLRPHDGDKPYAVGDTRVAEPQDVAHLVPKVLEPLDGAAAKPKAKAEPKVQNKADPALSNKAEG